MWRGAEAGREARHLDAKIETDRTFAAIGLIEHAVWNGAALKHRARRRLH